MSETQERAGGWDSSQLKLSQTHSRLTKPSLGEDPKNLPFYPWEP